MAKKQVNNNNYSRILQKLQKEYCKTRRELIKYLQDGNPRLSEDYKPRNDRSVDEILLDRLKGYEEELSIRLMTLLKLIARALAAKNHKVKSGRAVMQFNSLHKEIGSRVSIPWFSRYKTEAQWQNEQEEWKDTYDDIMPPKSRDVLFLQADMPSHLLTESIWRFNNNWLGIIRDEDHAKALTKRNSKKRYLCGISFDSDDFDQRFAEILNHWRKWSKAAVDLGEDYSEGDASNLSARAIKWVEKISDIKNIFIVPDIMESEQLAGVAIELDIPKNASLLDIDIFIEDCQWLLNRYVYDLILDVEKTYSLSNSDRLYRDVYFYKDNDNNTYPMLDSLVCYFASPEEPSKLNMDHCNAFCKSNDIKKLLKQLFRKLRIHFVLASGKRGDYIRGYKNHAYEVACTVAGIMDVLFLSDNDSYPGIEAIIRKSDRSLIGLDKKLQESNMPFLVSQLFKGLSKEDQLFLIPEYRDHFIHSFYVFVFGLILMCSAPDKVIPEKINLTKLAESGDKSTVMEILKKWFFVSMWHDIAYMVEKGNAVLEQHITSFLQINHVRNKGLLPWHPSLGSLMQAKGLLDQIRDLSGNAIEICSRLVSALTGEPAPTHSKNTEENEVLSSHVIIATAFERRDHGIWSGLMFNHGWEDKMNDFFDASKTKNTLHGIRREIVQAIMPHHLASWNVLKILKDYTDPKKHLSECNGDKLSSLLHGELACKKNAVCLTPLATISRHSNPLGYLLGICDMISQAGREAPELSRSPSDLGIKYKEIDFSNKRDEINTVNIKLHYKKPFQKAGDKKNQGIIDDRYRIPALVLGLKSVDGYPMKECLELNIGRQVWQFGVLPKA